jgi:hypothetical protein
MKRFLIGSAVTVFFAALSPAALAGEMAAAPETRTNNNDIQPFHLVQGAYQGQFNSQGISGFNSLVNGYEHSQIEAEDLVEAAIAQGRLSQDTLQDSGYLNAVSLQLQGLSGQTDSDN